MSVPSRNNLGCIVALSLFSLGCRVSQPSFSDCENNQECVHDFGPGATCNSSGFCDEYQPNVRCQKTYPNDLFINPTNYTDTVIIGNLMDQSLATHRARENSARLAIEQSNVAAQALDFDFGIVFCNIEEDSGLDEFTRSEAAIASANYLVDQLGAPAIIGPASSGDYLAVARALQPEQRPLLISPSATSPEITSLDPDSVSDSSPGLFWRTAPPDSFQGQAIAEDMTSMRAGRDQISSNVAVIHHTGSYGTAMTEVFALHFRQSGGRVTTFPYTESTALGTSVAEVALGDFDEVLFVSGQSTEVVSFLDAAASQQGFDDKRIFLTDSAANADVIAEAAPRLFAHVRGTRPARRDANDLIYASFAASYSGEFGEDVTQFSFTEHAYDAAWLIATGMAWAFFNEDTVTGTTIAKGLRKISSGPSIEIRPSSWTSILDQLRNGESLNYSGVSGELDYDAETEEISGPVETWIIDDGAIVPVHVWQPE